MTGHRAHYLPRWPWLAFAASFTGFVSLGEFLRRWANRIDNDRPSI